MMKVAVVHSFYRSMNSSGENQVVRDQIKQLRSMGIDVELISQRTDDHLARRGYRFRAGFHVATGTGYSPRPHIDSFRPDVVHVHNLFPNIGLKWLREVTVPIAVTFHNFRFGCSNGLFFRNGSVCHHCLNEPNSLITPVASGCYRNSSAATVPLALSRGLTRRAVASAGAIGVTLSAQSDHLVGQIMGSDFRRVLIPNFVDDFSRLSIGNVGTPTDWLYAGRLSDEKGISELIDLWPDDERLTVIGSGPLEQRIASQATLRANVRFLGGLDRQDLRGRLRAYLGLIFPSRWVEVAPQVVVEAMCASIPVVALEGSAASAMVLESGAGAIYSETSPSSLRTALQQVRMNHSQMSEAARAYYEAEWTPSVWSRRIQELYLNLTR